MLIRDVTLHSVLLTYLDFPPSLHIPECVACYPYKSQFRGDLSFEVGDPIIVTQTLENGWWRGKRGERRGWFPGSYVMVRQREDQRSQIHFCASCCAKISLHNSKTYLQLKFKLRICDDQLFHFHPSVVLRISSTHYEGDYFR